MLDGIQTDARVEALVSKSCDAQPDNHVHGRVLSGDSGVDDGPVQESAEHGPEERVAIRRTGLARTSVHFAVSRDVCAVVAMAS
jgi:hypothetical protein